MVFWGGVALAAGLILLIIWLPVIRSGSKHKHQPAADIRDRTNVGLYQQQMALADKQFSAQEKQSGMLDQFKQELSLSLLQNMQPQDNSRQIPAQRPSWVMPILMTLLVLLIPPVGFSLFGQYAESVDYSRQANTDPFVGMDIEQIQDRVVTELQQRIRQSPGDSEAWFMLGQRYLNSNEFDNALIAFERVAKLRGNDAEVITAKAATLYYQAGQRMTPQAQALINQALQLEPNQVTALMLQASDYFLNAQYQQAIDIWQQLLDRDNPQINRAKLIEAINMARMMSSTK
ncbi:c-type cytochrome biogenesis protein CcmI [Pragia fontium]|uniref:Cytochrome c-type biogenesis protein CcmI n=1 Tax=Pragia fontium DSM 5563 = ATCC 49100 TaxID=1122977 RepID=A0AAJ4WCE9_9GAMM|nr:c-type cytochrome biogenesis protein CcmI [Pragia fontium]SFD20445.1 cytochrome c-type biogenesis protein CcmI [Pragia fontium DSM 5563 = ATCC 49100]VEJ57002.1 Formate-dependent nitrite reductase complex subunit nrfG [Pragia fontium]